MLNKGQFIAIFIRLTNIALNMLLQFAMAAVLNKEHFANIAIGKSLFQSFDYTHLGTRYAMDRLLPKAPLLMKSRLFYASMSITFLASILLSLIWVLSGYTSATNLLFIAAGILYAIISLYKIYHRSVFNFRAFNRVSFLNDNFVALVQILGLYVVGYMGVPTGIFIAYTAVLAVVNRGKLFRALKQTFEYSNQWLPGAKILFHHGFLLFLNAALLFLVLVADKLIIGHYYPKTVVADYAFVLMCQALLIMVPSTLIEVQISKLMVSRQLRAYFRFWLLVQGLLAFVYGFVYLIFPIITEYFFPNYSHLGPMFGVVGIGAMLSAPGQVLNVYFQSVDRRKVIFTANCVAVGIYNLLFFSLCLSNASSTYLFWAKNLYYALLLIFLLGYFIYLRTRLLSN